MIKCPFCNQVLEKDSEGNLEPDFPVCPACQGRQASQWQPGECLGTKETPPE